MPYKVSDFNSAARVRCSSTGILLNQTNHQPTSQLVSLAFVIHHWIIGPAETSDKLAKLRPVNEIQHAEGPQAIPCQANTIPSQEALSPNTEIGGREEGGRLHEQNK